MAYRSATLAVPDGGTGLKTLTAHSIQVGNGASNVTQLAVGATGTVLTGVTSSNPAFSATPTVTSLTLGSGTALSSYVELNFNGTIQGATTGGSTTYTLQSCTSVKFGKLVWFMGTISWTAATGTGLIQVGGLPYPIAVASGTTSYPAAFLNNNLTIATATSIVCDFASGNSYFTIYGFIDSTGTLVNSSLAANQANFINISGTYLTSS